MSPLGFAWKSLSRAPARAALGIAGVAVVGALLFDMLLLSRGLLLSFGDLLRETGFEVRVIATKSLPGLGPPISGAGEAVSAIRSLPEVRDAVRVRFGEGTVVLPSRITRDAVVYGFEAGRSTEGRILEGRDLAGESAGGVPEALVNRDLARDMALRPGSVLALRPGTTGAPAPLPAREFLVAGIAAFPFEVEGSYTIRVPLEAYRDAGFGPEEDEADMILVAVPEGRDPAETVRAIEAVRGDLHSFSIGDFLESFRRTDFSYFRQMSFVLSTITSFFTFLLVATLLTVSVNQRLGEVAALRALGFPRSRVALDLLAESALLVGTGGLLAVPLGLLLARVLDGILRQIPGLPERLHFFVFSPRALLLHLLLVGGAGLLAAAWPVLLSARLPIAATLRREVIS